MWGVKKPHQCQQKTEESFPCLASADAGPLDSNGCAIEFSLAD